MYCNQPSGAFQLTRCPLLVSGCLRCTLLVSSPQLPSSPVHILLTHPRPLHASWSPAWPAPATRSPSDNNGRRRPRHIECRESWATLCYPRCYWPSLRGVCLGVPDWPVNRAGPGLIGCKLWCCACARQPTATEAVQLFLPLWTVKGLIPQSDFDEKHSSWEKLSISRLVSAVTRLAPR